MWKSLKPATAIALALGLGGCAHLESPTSLMGGSNDRSSHPSVFPDKSDIDNQMRLADASLKSGNQAAAISMYRSLAREYPMALRPRIALGEALLAANAPQEAARAFEGALKLKGNSTQALVGLGRVELALHQPAKALENFDRAAKVDAKSTAAHNGRAVALDQLEQPNSKQLRPVARPRRKARRQRRHTCGPGGCARQRDAHPPEPCPRLWPRRQ
jgi:tetratricopeptide (TPR) repeat protein